MIVVPLSIFSITKIALLVQIFLLFTFQMAHATSSGKNVALINGKIRTINPEKPMAEAVYVIGEKIVFVGSTREVKEWIKPETKVIDLRGRLVLPGFNDAHVHFSDGGFSLLELNLRPAKNRDEFAAKIKTYAATLPEGTWITGGNWDHEKWPDKKYPDRRLLDMVSGNHPVFVNRLDGHVAVANSLALHLAGINKDTPSPDGGFIERDGNGEATGIVKDNALELVTRHIPAPPAPVRLQAISAALQHAAQLGITSVQDVSPAYDFHLYQQLVRQEKLTCRINAVMPIETHTEYLRRMGVEYHFGNSLLRIGSVKCFSDGSMGASSALLFEPFTDDGASSGLAIYSKSKLMELIAAAHKNNLQVYCHAIGDKANCWTLDAFESAIDEYGQKDLRHRIEHAQLVAQGDFQRFADLNVIASVQPSHCIDDMRWAETRIGKERCRRLFAFRSFLQVGAHIAFGTDWPVEDLNPMLGLYAAVTREFPQGGPAGGWFPEQKIDMQQAVTAYTLGAAYAEHEEKNKGTIEPGKLADLIVLDRDIFSVPPEEILSAKVELTMMGGEIVFVRD